NQQNDIGRRGILHPPVGVVDLRSAAPAHRPLQGRQSESLVEAATQLPAPNAAGGHVHEDRQVDEFFLEADAGDPTLAAHKLILEPPALEVLLWATGHTREGLPWPGIRMDAPWTTGRAARLWMQTAISPRLISIRVSRS